MRTTISYKHLSILLQASSVFILFASLDFIAHSPSTSEKITFLIIFLLSAAFLLWCLLAYVLVGLSYLIHDVRNLPVWVSFAIRPLFLGLAGTALISSQTPSHAQAESTYPLNLNDALLSTSNFDESTLFFQQTQIPITIAASYEADPAESGESSGIFFSETAESASTKTNQYVIVQGDTLWSIAKNHLPDNASPGQVYQKVIEIYQQNDQILSDPETVIYPGQIITIP